MVAGGRRSHVPSGKYCRHPAAWPGSPLGRVLVMGRAGIVIAVLVSCGSRSARASCSGLSRSIWKVRTRRVLRSESSTSARPPLAAIWMPAKRCSVLKTSRGSPVKGAFSATMLSRNGAWFFRSPPSSASTQRSVPGSLGRHWTLRGPVITPLIGTLSSSGRLATLCSTLPAEVPHLDLLGKLGGGMQVGERPVHGGDQQVLAVGRDAHRRDDARLADGRDFAGGGVHSGELRGGVIVEQILVVRSLQHVFVGHHGSRAAQALLHVRPGRHQRQRPAPRRDSA